VPDRNLRFRNKVAVITGAAQGMGAAFARLFAAEGASVVASDVNTDAAERLADELVASGARAIMIPCDVAKPSECRALIAQTIDAFGAVHILVNNAGILRRTRVTDISEEEWRLVMAVNVDGVFFCSQAAVAPMKEQRWGRIINMSSTAGRTVSTLGGCHYTASKHAVMGITRAFAKELAPFGITVNAICPGLIATEMVLDNTPPEELRRYEQSFPIPRLGTPEEAAWLAGFIASDEAAYITGAAFDLSGGDLMI
jgi:3-oxoacyl-[acyl-carrier protein] reductase